jgi:hypothetical protein
VTPFFAEPEIVDMRSPAVLEHQHQLMLATIKGAHAGVALGPDAELFEFRVRVVAGRKHLP